MSKSQGRLAVVSCLVSVLLAGCGHEAVAPVGPEHPTAPPPPPPPAIDPDGPQGQSIAVELARQFAAHKYPDQLMLSKPLASFIPTTTPLTPIAGPPITGPVAIPGGFPPPATEPDMNATAAGVLTPEQLAELRQPKHQGPLSPTPPSIDVQAAPKTLHVRSDKGWWKVLFPLLKVRDDEQEAPIAYRQFHVQGGQVQEMDPVRAPVRPTAHGHPGP